MEKLRRDPTNLPADYEERVDDLGNEYRRERRIDIIELRTMCRAIGVTLAEFVDEYETGLTATVAKRSRR